MDYRQRYKKVKLLVKKVNQQRKKQARQIDLLCNDLIGAHRKFIKALDTVSFTAKFYESVLAKTDLNDLLYTAGELIQAKIADANVIFFLKQDESFKMHLCTDEQEISEGNQRLERHFTSELVNAVCNSNKICDISCLCAMGLQVNPNLLNKLSVVTIPLNRFGPSLGFILVYRSSQDELTPAETASITAVTSGLCRAIQSCQVASGCSG